tara:strand:+ start:807 stop:2039 length:1233 start_codon:yes stop_codon:yes gene_type:complete
MVDSVSKSMQLLPEYQENYLKDLLANVFKYDSETDTVSGIAAEDPLEGKQIYQTADGGTTLDSELAALNDAGNPIELYESLEGGFTDNFELAALDQYGQPRFALEGGVNRPEVAEFTDAQQEAIDRLVGRNGFEGMMGSYEPYLESAEGAFQSGMDLAGSSTASYDPQGQIQYDTVDNGDGTTSQVPRLDAEGNPVRAGGYKDFYDPFVEDVIDASFKDIDRAGVEAGMNASAEAIGSGAFGGSRRGIVESELQRNILDQKAKTGSQLRSAAYTGAQTQAQSAFENQQSRGQSAGQLFQGLGTGMGALGEASQNLGFTDINTLFNTGALEQNQEQRSLDVQRAGQLESAYEPFARFSYMRDILSGVPSSGTGLTATGTPQPSAASNMFTNSNLNMSRVGGLGSIKNVNGA